MENLKASIRVHGVNFTDKIWMTCCALHNLLIDVDGLSNEWNGELGLHDEEDGSRENIPFALQRLQNGPVHRNYDTSGMEPCFMDRSDTDDDDIEASNLMADNESLDSTEDTIDPNVINDLTALSMKTFRVKLVTHFDIIFARNKIKWPRRV